MTDHQKIIKAQNKRMPDAMAAVLNPQAWTVAWVDDDELPGVFNPEYERLNGYYGWHDQAELNAAVQAVMLFPEGDKSC